MSRLGSLEAEPETRIWCARLTDWGSALRSEGSKTAKELSKEGWSLQWSLVPAWSEGEPWSTCRAKLALTEVKLG